VLFFFRTFKFLDQKFRAFPNFHIFGPYIAPNEAITISEWHNRQTPWLATGQSPNRT